MLGITINIIVCDIPAIKVMPECADDDVYNIYVNNPLSSNKICTEILHELRHIVNDDFHLDQHANLVEQMVRMFTLGDNDLGDINFYYHNTTLKEIGEMKRINFR